MRIRIVMMSAIVVIVGAMLVACATTSGTFESVYTGFKKELNLSGATSHTVVAGDTLSAITIKAYGAEHGYYFPMIMGASSEVVTHPDKIAPGMVLTIPDFDKNVNDPVIAKRIKKWFLRVAEIYRSEENNFVADKIQSVADSL